MHFENIDAAKVAKVTAIVVVIVLAFVFMNSATKYIKDIFGLSDEGEVNDDAPIRFESSAYVAAGGDPSFDPSSYVSQMRTALTTYSFDSVERCRAWERWLELGDNEFILCANTYFANRKRSIRADMADLWAKSCKPDFFYLGPNTTYNEFIERLDDLSIQ